MVWAPQTPEGEARRFGPGPRGGGGVPTCAAVAVLLALAVQQQREHHQQDDQQTGEHHHQEEPPLLVEGRLHLSCRATGARSRGRKLCPRRDRGRGTPAWSGLSWADPPVSRRGSGSALSLGPGLPSPPLPPPLALASELTFPISSVVWVTGREGQKCPALLLSPSMGAFSPDTPKPPGHPRSRCHHLVSSPPPATRTPLNPWHHREFSGGKLAPPASAAPTSLGMLSKPGSPMTDPSGRELDAPTPAAHTLRLGGLSATCWPPPLRQGPPPMEAGAVFYVFRAPSTTELL